MIAVGIVEDDNDIREGIRKYLHNQSNMLCEISVDSVEGFIDALRYIPPPDVALMDIGLPGMSGISGMKLLKEDHPDTDIIMLTVYNDWQKIFDSLCAGASGYLLKNTPLSEIRRGIEAVHAGGAAMSPEIARKVMEFFGPRVTTPPESSLTPREKEIVIGLVDGLSYKLIGDRMGVSVDTIRFHIKNVYRKLQVNSKAEVIARSLRGEI